MDKQQIHHSQCPGCGKWFDWKWGEAYFALGMACCSGKCQHKAMHVEQQEEDPEEYADECEQIALNVNGMGENIWE